MHQDREAGVGLVEIVMAILVLGVAISALLAALITGVRASTAHRELTTQDTVLRSYAEAVKSAVRATCGSGNWTATYPGGSPAGYSVSPASGPCPALAGFQTVQISAVGPTGTKMMDIAVRRP